MQKLSICVAVKAILYSTALPVTEKHVMQPLLFSSMCTGQRGSGEGWARVWTEMVTVVGYTAVTTVGCFGQRNPGIPTPLLQEEDHFSFDHKMHVLRT